MSTPLPGHHLNSELELRALLDGAGLRPTAQRLGLTGLLFGGAHRHVTAGELHLEAAHRRLAVSVATVYNTLNQLVATGLLTQVQVEADCTYYDTNTEPHGHLFYTDTGELVDTPLPTIPRPLQLEGVELLSVDLLFRVRRRR
ncbi:MAG TPA: transcriptional repressor [Deltaproteobacteria bacterium]|nr:transcriptional repressor [Deltaproteobacteria bacterium]